MKKVLSMWIIVLILIMILSGCMEQATESDQELGVETEEIAVNLATEDEGPSQGGVLNLFMLNPDTLNPLTTQNVTVRQFSSFVFDGLFYQTKDQTIEEALVDSYSFGQSNLILDIKLKDNIFFHDGEALSSDDVAYTVETIKSTGEGSMYWSNVTNIKNIKAIDRLSLRIIFEKPEALLRKLTFPIIPEHVFKDWPIQGHDDDLKPIGTGPFKFDSYKENDITLLRNDSWWNINAIGGLNHPIWLDAITFKVFSNESEMMQAFQKKEIDIAYLEEGKFESYKKRSDIFLSQYESDTLEFLALSSIGRAGSPIEQENFRTILIQYLSWYGTLNPINRGAPAFKYLSESGSTKGVINRESILGAFAEAGFTYKEDKNILVFYKNGSSIPVTLSLKYNGLNMDRQAVSEWISAALFEIGINVISETTSISDQQVFVKSGKYDMMLLGCRLPLFVYGYEIIEPVKESLNFSGKNSVILPLYRKYRAVLYHNRVRGTKTPICENIYNGWSEWYIVQ